MRRLLFVTQTHTVWGGMEWWVHHLAARMQKRGWRVYAGLAQGARFSDPAAYARAHPHLEPVVMDGRAGSERARVRAVARTLRRVNADVVIPVGVGATFDAIGTVDAALLVPVLSLHPDWLANIFARREDIDLALPNSRLLERLLLRELEPSRVRYIRQGVPHATMPRSPRTQRLRVAIVSRLEESSKRVLDLARVAALADDDIELHVFGDGPDRAALETSLGARATFHGYLPTERLYVDAYPKLDVLLLFSPAEGSPNAVYEAMQNGVVPVSSRFMGSASEGILRDGASALLFAVADAEAAAAHLRSLARDRALLERMSNAARDAVAGYDDDDMYARWEAAIESTPRHTGARTVRPLPPAAGRLERAHLPQPLADLLRHVTGSRFPHASGWQEWPGSQPAAPAEIDRINRALHDIERSAADER